MNTENISQMILITLLGLLVVFSVLIVLWAVIEIMHAIVSRVENKVSGGNDTEKKSVAAEAPAAPAPVQTAVAAAEDDGEIAAVIAAAIAAFTSGGNNSSSTYNLRIKSFRRISTSRSAWNSESRGGYEII